MGATRQGEPGVLCPVRGYPYKIRRDHISGNLINKPALQRPKLHFCDVADFIEKGTAGGYPADCKLIALVNCNYVNSFPHVNRIVRALKSKNVEFIFIQEQFMTATAKLADIVLPTNTFLERNDITVGVGLPFYGCVRKAIESRGESKSHFEIAALLASRLGISGFEDSEEEAWLRDRAENGRSPIMNSSGNRESIESNSRTLCFLKRTNKEPDR